jgi:hypothetical protein
VPDAAGYTTGYGYDAIGRLNSVTPAGGFAPTAITFVKGTSAAYGLPADRRRPSKSAITNQQDVVPSLAVTHGS